MTTLRLILLPALAAAASFQPSARADDDAHARVSLLPKYQQECGACHLAYPPDLLPTRSWQRIMNTLNKHFGTDASLDASVAKELSIWLTANAGTGKRARQAPPEDRITRAPWFEREHDEVAAATWKLPVVKSAANCAACHTKADQGDFRERNIRIPR
jgi:nitrate/TMAO reductase-like tetraheme cytochrome c subunit